MSIEQHVSAYSEANIGFYNEFDVIYGIGLLDVVLLTS